MGGELKLSYTHEVMVDMLIAFPQRTVKELAAEFGYSVAWMTRIMRSDSFRELVAARKKELMDPVVLQGIEKRLEALAHLAVGVLEEKMEAAPSADLALKTLSEATKGLGMGAKPAVSVNMQTNYVVTMPQKEATGREWLQAHSPRLIEGTAEDPTPSGA